MYMFNNGPPPPCPWGGYNPANRQMYMNGPQPFPPGPPHPAMHNNMMPQHMRHWQGPGPSRMRGRGYRRGRGSSSHFGNNRNQGQVEELVKDVCCRCGERLQNSEQLGIHMCDGGGEIHLEVPRGSGLDPVDSTDQDKEEDTLETRLEKLLESLKDFVRGKYDSMTEALEDYVTGKIDEINTLYKENSEEKLALEKMRTELQEKAERLIKQEKELKDKQRRLSKDQESFKREMKKEREEVCRQWQQLRDEIVRMEEMHNIQKGRIKLDVGGHVFTTSKLTLTREADSMLAAMFSGRHELVKEEDGCVFIDRDGTHFRYVLNYLRDGGVAMDCLPRDRQILKELKKEATFYQLHGLMQQIEKYLY